MKILNLIFLLSIFLVANTAPIQLPRVKNLKPQMGLIVEHVNNLNTLTLSFIDSSQPVYNVKLQILSEFLKSSQDPRLLLLVAEQDIRLLNAFIKKQKPKFDFNKIQYVLGENLFLDSPWVRDFSPVMIQKKDGSHGLVIFKYIKEFDYEKDQNALAAALNLPKPIRVNLRLEGGNILSDEAGRLYISTAVIDNNIQEKATLKDRAAKKIEIENLLKNSLLTSEVVWLNRLDREFEATGHVDMYMRLLKNQQAVVADSDEPKIKKGLDDIAKILALKGFKISRMKANSQIVNTQRNQKILPSYTNSIIVGESIFIPKYQVAEDDEAVRIYKELGYQVVQIDGETIYSGGSVHCLTYLYPSLNSFTLN